VPPGPQVLRVERIGFATARARITFPTEGFLVRDVELSWSALEMEGITVTADATGRARGELGTATVIEQEAIEHQTATSLAGVLELRAFSLGSDLTPPSRPYLEMQLTSTGSFLCAPVGRYLRGAFLLWRFQPASQPATDRNNLTPSRSG